MQDADTERMKDAIISLLDEMKALTARLEAVEILSSTHEKCLRSVCVSCRKMGRETKDQKCLNRPSQVR